MVSVGGGQVEAGDMHAYRINDVSWSCAIIIVCQGWMAAGVHVSRCLSAPGATSKRGEV